MDEWIKEQADFLKKIGQLPPAAPTPKPATKKDEE
jgi:hypothetical protein